MIGITDKGDVFGAYISVAVKETVGNYKDIRDDGQFAFSFFSHGRCDVPQRWGLRNDKQNSIEIIISDPTDSEFLWFGVCVGFDFSNGPMKSTVLSPGESFEGLGDSVLTGDSGEHFTTVRLLVVRLE